MTVRFRSNLPQLLDGLEEMSEAAVEAVARDAARGARRRVARDTGATARSIGHEVLSPTRARVGATEEAGRYLETREDYRGRYEWLGPALAATEGRAQALATAAAHAKARQLAARLR